MIIGFSTSPSSRAIWRKPTPGCARIKSSTLPRPAAIAGLEQNAGGIKAFYFRDPDRHYLEILQFPDGKGDRKWHQPSDRLFLGIDHTAIVVTNTDASLKFYRDVLGLSIAGTSENYGVEQEHLNNVFGARLRITNVMALIELGKPQSITGN